MGSGEVITIDVDRKFHNFGNSQAACRVNFIEGSSLDPKVVDLVFRRSTGRRCMVVLDSWHSYDHVTEELKTYWGLVSPGCYLIVEDTHVSGHPVEWEWGKGPYEAVDEFIIDHKDKFDRDLSRERHLMTFNPNGFLRRKS
jgi:cephalosporin hydroxylase